MLGKIEGGSRRSTLWDYCLPGDLSAHMSVFDCVRVAGSVGAPEDEAWVRQQQMLGKHSMES